MNCKDILQFEFRSVSENEFNGFIYVHTTRYVNLELEITQSNTERYCTNVRDSTVRSSMISSTAIVISLQKILIRCDNDSLTT